MKKFPHSNSNFSSGVAYLHGTKEKPYYENGGEYVFFPYGPGADAMELKPKRGQAILMDGGRMIHGVARTAPGYQVAAIDKDVFNRIEYQGNNTWYLLSDDELIDVFKTSDLRMTFVWRGLCFHDEAEKAKFEQHLKDEVAFHKEIAFFKSIFQGFCPAVHPPQTT